MTQTQDALLTAAIGLRDDLLDRARWDGETKVVVAGNGAWFRFNEAIEAHLRSTSPAGEVGNVVERLRGEMDNNFDGHCYTITQDTLDFAYERLAASDTEAMRRAVSEALEANLGVGMIDARAREVIIRNVLARIDALAKGGAA